MKKFRKFSEAITPPQQRQPEQGREAAGGRFASSSLKGASKPAPQVTSEAKDEQEYGYEGDMAMNQLKTIIRHSEYLMDMLKPDTDLPEWVQSKITLAADYIQTSCDYMTSELDEGAVPSTEKVVTVKHKTSGKELVVTAQKAKEYQKQGYHPVKEEHLEEGPFSSGVLKPTEKFKKQAAEIQSSGTYMGKDHKGVFTAKMVNHKEVSRVYHAKEEVEQIEEGRPSQRHPLEGHEYHKKTDAELVYIAKDAHKAAEAMKGHNTTAENKYRDQANDSATVRHYRKTHGMADWYKKKYGHVNESFKPMDEPNMNLSIQARQKKADGKDDSQKKLPQGADFAAARRKARLASNGRMDEAMKSFETRVTKDKSGKVTSWETHQKHDKAPGSVTDKSGAKHSKLSRVKHLAKMGMKKVNEEGMGDPGLIDTNAKLTLAKKKTNIIKGAAKNAKEKNSNKFNADPVLSSPVAKQNDSV